MPKFVARRFKPFLEFAVNLFPRFACRQRRADVGVQGDALARAVEAPACSSEDRLVGAVEPVKLGSRLEIAVQRVQILRVELPAEDVRVDAPCLGEPMKTIESGELIAR